MKPLFGYLFLANGIIFGIASNSLAKISEGFTKLTPSILCILFMCITMFSIAKAMSALPVGVAYSTYSGLTVTGVVLFAVLRFNQVPNIYGTIGIILIVIGVVMVNYLGRLNWYFFKISGSSCIPSLSKGSSNSSTTFLISRGEYKCGYISPFDACSQSKCSSLKALTFNKIRFSLFG